MPTPPTGNPVGAPRTVAPRDRHRTRHVAASDALWARVVAAADAAGVSVSQWIRAAIVARLDGPAQGRDV